jgi:two-component system sensor histidine kinase RegB
LALGQKQLASLTTLSAGAAHELSTPLGTMAIAVCELERELENCGLNKNFVQDLELIKSQLKRCKDILGQMSARSGELEDSSEQTSLAQYFSGLEEDFNKKFGNKIVLERLKDDRITAFPQQAVTQSFFALVKNAIEASPENKQVSIRPVLKGENLKVQITDNGSGMSEKILSRVGEPFFTTKEIGQGMGLGVFLTKLTIEHLGGEINYFSKEGKGTTVEVDIPIK